MKRQYEIMVLVRAEADMESEKKWEELIGKLVGDTASLKGVLFLGKKQLAYPIKKQTEAAYLVATLEGGPLSVAELEKRAKLEEQVLRFLLTAKD